MAELTHNERATSFYIFTFFLRLTGVKKGGSSRWDVSWRHHSNTVYGSCTTAAGWKLASHCIRDVWCPRCSFLANWLKTKKTENSPLNKWKLSVFSDFGFLPELQPVKVAVQSVPKPRDAVQRCLPPPSSGATRCCADGRPCCSDAAVRSDVAAGPDQLSSVPLTSRYHVFYTDSLCAFKRLYTCHLVHSKGLVHSLFDPHSHLRDKL